MKIQRKMYEANKALSYFVTNNWNFKNENFLNLCNFLRCEDQLSFDFRGFFAYDSILYIRTTIYGYRKYLMNLKDEDLEKDRLTVKRLKMGFNALKLFFKCLIAFILYKKFFEQ